MGPPTNQYLKGSLGGAQRGAMVEHTEIKVSVNTTDRGTNTQFPQLKAENR